MPSRFLSVLAVSLFLAWSPVAALAQGEPTEGGGGGNVALAINTKDGSSTFKVSFRIVRTSSDVVDESNVAFAFASCEECETVAIAFQVVLVGGSPTTVIPENYAIALNFECISCQTLASAYQFVLGTDGNVHFSPEGNRALAEIRTALQQLRSSDLSLEGIQAELDLLAADLRTVLAEELLSAGPPDVEVEEVAATPGTSEPTPIPSSSPATVDPSPSPTADAVSPSPEDTTTPPDGQSPSPATSPTPTSATSASPDSSPTPSASVSP